MKTLTALLFAGSAALALSACSKNDETANTYAAQDTMATNSAALSDNTMAAMPIELTPTQRQARQALDMQSYESEYRSYEDQPMPSASSTQTATPSMASTGAGTGSAAGSGASTSGAMANGGMGNSSAGGNPNATTAPQNMTFAQLDRNHDGKLSVAEYAVYAVGVNPVQPAPNDQKRPHATADQLNRAADTFFQYDMDGNTYLSPAEFANAQRAGAASTTR